MYALDDDLRIIDNRIFLINQFNQSVSEGMNLTEVKKRLQLTFDDADQHFSLTRKGCLRSGTNEALHAPP